ncbi:MAG TPA: hypothetical protein VFV19_16380 [Candidatus Polarisedimenticolaceae bacterium]|nr:hypothetical protein [Candidatus Polarisedimenticolaceae bacterium]
MKLDVGGALRGSLALLFALAGISGATAGECIPDLTHYTATPTISWAGADASTAGYKVYWKRAEDVAWRGVIDLPVWPGDDVSSPVHPGITESFPLQRLIPDVDQGLLVDVQVTAYNAARVEGKPSTILRLCMPQVWRSGPYR